MPSPKLRLLQDESVAIEKEITDLRSLEPKDDADRASIEERLNAAMSRAEKVTADAQREQEIDARLAALAVVRNTSGSRDQVEREFRPENVEHDFSRPDIRAGVRAFRSVKVAEDVGEALVRMARGETRAMGETNSGYGDNYVITELYDAIINRLQYQSVFMQLASVFRPKGQSIVLPKSGDFTVSFVGENVAFTDQDLTTSGPTLTLNEAGGSVPVSNALINDSPVDVAGLIVDRVSYGFSVWYDTKVLTGNGSSPTIAGLPAAVAAIGGNPNTVTVALNATTTAANLADVVGKVDETIMGTGAWVCSRAGYVDLMKIWAAQQTTAVVGGGRVVPTIAGAPVYISKGMPATTLALYGDFSKSTALGFAKEGIQITVAKELLVRSRATLFVATSRLGVLNHGPEFVGRLAKATS
jgi:HK97 family phage major capsid protein